ncbi:FAD-binding molybdopterin dehydrogenase [Planctomycetota bacterium]|nr:FAD-binding molybdopterin dehydrogenase [Planctomycetota bacterium]
MKPFTYILPRSLPEAATAAARKGAQLKAAGIDLIDRMKERIETPSEVVNLLSLKGELSYIKSERDSGLRIGALTTLNDLELDAALGAAQFGALREAAGRTATPLVRNRATIVGNLLQVTRCWYLRSAAFGCLHGKKGPACLAMTGENRYHSVMGYFDCVRVHPSNLAPALLALDAEFTSQLGDRQSRRKLSELFPKEARAMLAEHTLLPGEIVTAIHVPAQPANARSAYRESREKLSFDWATTACAARIVVEGGKIRTATLVLGAVAPVPMPMPEAAKLLIGEAPSDELFQKVANAAYQSAVPLSQNVYKVQVGKAVVRETLHAITR